MSLLIFFLIDLDGDSGVIIKNCVGGLNANTRNSVMEFLMMKFTL